ncbi:DcrB-related protein [Caldimonas brevitalea]|uniref:DUF1795 domain-containing protein n=1 Tax=Caldimonas brevitalea TaxID=413882 RepID=A0A0G3BW30_9BURK|nr:DcrB-related protein [Caldimonas brevitalea]AKJ30735.1 hypothetical protein AAW51_4044 [Caldimonas brevitalea]
MQNIGEGSLDIPGEWHNRTVNVFTAQGPGVPGLSVTVNRDRLPFQTTLNDYTQQQSHKLAQQLKGWELIDEVSLEVDGRAARQLEFSWETDDAGPVHQVLLCVADGQTLLNLAASFGGRMSEAQVAEAKRILHSFRFAAPEDAGSAASSAA